MYIKYYTTNILTPQNNLVHTFRPQDKTFKPQDKIFSPQDKTFKLQDNYFYTIQIFVRQNLL